MAGLRYYGPLETPACQGGAMLFMKKQYFDAIRSGRKTTTLRYWRGRLVRPDSIHSVRGLGRVHVQDVREVRLEQLTDADAQADGFDTLAELKRTLDEYYPPEKRQGRTLYQVRFSFVQEASAT